jgi:hypothetical protein
VQRLTTGRKALFAGLVFVVFWGLLEGAARIAGPIVVGEAFDAPTGGGIWAREGWVIDPELGWTLPPNDSRMHGGALVETNARGYRCPDFEETKPPGGFRVVVVGDSTSMGFGVQQAAIFSSELQRLLAERSSSRIEVLNLGTPGYSSEQARLMLETRGMGFETDVVVFLSNYNDRRTLSPEASPDSREHFADVAERVASADRFRWSAVVRLARLLLGGEASSLIASGHYTFDEIAVDAPVRVPLDRYEANVRSIVETAEASDARVILVALPDNPAMIQHVVQAQQALDEGRLWDAERALLKKGWPMYRLVARRTLNEILRAGGRESEAVDTIPALGILKTTGGHMPSTLHTPYVDVLSRVAESTSATLIEVHAPDGVEPHAIYLDATHLNVRGHAWLARALAEQIEGA